MISDALFLTIVLVTSLLGCCASSCIFQKASKGVCSATAVAEAWRCLSPNRSDLLFAGFYCSIAAMASSHWSDWTNEAAAVGWYVAHMLLGLAYFAVALYGRCCNPSEGAMHGWHKKPIFRLEPSWQFGLFWTINVLIFIPLSIAVHWLYAASVPYTLALTVVHVGMLFLFLPVHLSLGVVAALLLLAHPIYARMHLPISLDPFGWHTAAIGLLSLLTFPYCRKQYLDHRQKMARIERWERARRKEHLREVLEMEFRLGQLCKLDQVRLDATKDVLVDLKIKWWKHKNGKSAFSAEAYHFIVKQFRYLYNQSIENINEMTYDLAEILEEEEERIQESEARAAAAHAAKNAAAGARTLSLFGQENAGSEAEEHREEPI